MKIIKARRLSFNLQDNFWQSQSSPFFTISFTRTCSPSYSPPAAGPVLGRSQGSQEAGRSRIGRRGEEERRRTERWAREGGSVQALARTPRVRAGMRDADGEGRRRIGRRRKGKETKGEGRSRKDRRSAFLATPRPPSAARWTSMGQYAALAAAEGEAGAAAGKGGGGSGGGLAVGKGRSGGGGAAAVAAAAAAAQGWRAGAGREAGAVALVKRLAAVETGRSGGGWADAFGRRGERRELRRRGGRGSGARAVIGMMRLAWGHLLTCESGSSPLATRTGAGRAEVGLRASGGTACAHADTESGRRPQLEQGQGGRNALQKTDWTGVFHGGVSIVHRMTLGVRGGRVGDGVGAAGIRAEAARVIRGACGAGCLSILVVDNNGRAEPGWLVGACAAEALAPTAPSWTSGRGRAGWLELAGERLAKGASEGGGVLTVRVNRSGEALAQPDGWNWRTGKGRDVPVDLFEQGIVEARREQASQGGRRVCRQESGPVPRTRGGVKNQLGKGPARVGRERGGGGCRRGEREARAGVRVKGGGVASRTRGRVGQAAARGGIKGRASERGLAGLRTLEGVRLRRSAKQLERHVPPCPGIDGRGTSTGAGTPATACRTLPGRTKDPAFAKLRGGGGGR